VNYSYSERMRAEVRRSQDISEKTVAISPIEPTSDINLGLFETRPPIIRSTTCQAGRCSIGNCGIEERQRKDKKERAQANRHVLKPACEYLQTVHHRRIFRLQDDPIPLPDGRTSQRWLKEQMTQRNKEGERGAMTAIRRGGCSRRPVVGRLDDIRSV
jgi:hypothetical protein